MNIIIEPNAKKEIKKLPKSDIPRILKKLYSIRENPLEHIERLKGLRLWKLRVGEYRCIVYADTGKDNLHVLKVGHRKAIYKRLKS